LLKATSSVVAVLLALGIASTAAGAVSSDYRAEGRAGGGDRPLAVEVAHALLAQRLPLQLTRVRCERAAGRDFCGLSLAGVKFKRRVDTATFTAEVDALVRGAFAVDPAIAEVDLWVSVPANSGKGMVASGDFALPTTATVYSITVPRAQATHPDDGSNVFWDPAFRSELAAGSLG
jgi:hypothetical protein